MNDESQLPAEFADLAGLVEHWAIGEEAARNARRLASTMEELRGFYDVMLPRVPQIAEYLDQFPLEGLTAAQNNLLNLALTFMEIAPSLEIFHAVDVPNSFAADRFHILPPFETPQP